MVIKNTVEIPEKMNYLCVSKTRNHEQLYHPIYRFWFQIVDFPFNELEEIRKFDPNAILYYEDGFVFLDKLGFRFLQMQSFNKSEKELVTHYDKWRYFLKHLENFDDIPQILNEPIFEKAFKTAELDTMPHQEWEVYQRNKLVYIELKAAMDTAREDGLKIGILQGKTLRIAKVMKDKGEPIDVIVDYTGVSIEEIEKL